MNDGDLLLKEHGQKPSLASWPFVIMIVVRADGNLYGAREMTGSGRVRFGVIGYRYRACGGSPRFLVSLNRVEIEKRLAKRGIYAGVPRRRGRIVGDRLDYHRFRDLSSGPSQLCCDQELASIPAPNDGAEHPINSGRRNSTATGCR